MALRGEFCHLIQSEICVGGCLEAESLGATDEIFRIRANFGRRLAQFGDLVLVNIMSPVSEHRLKGGRTARIFGALPAPRQQSKVGQLNLPLASLALNAASVYQAPQ